MGSMACVGGGGARTRCVGVRRGLATPAAPRGAVGMPRTAASVGPRTCGPATAQPWLLRPRPALAGARPPKEPRGGPA